MDKLVLVLRGMFEEAEHPRYPKGHKKGGKWKPKGAAGASWIDSLSAEETFSVLENNSSHAEAANEFSKSASEDIEWILENFGDPEHDPSDDEADDYSYEDNAFTALQNSIEDKFKQLVKGSTLHVMRPSASLEGLMKFGRLSTLHTAPDDVREKIESGWTDTWLREEFERDGLGVDPRTTPLTERPVYGVVRRNDVGDAAVRQYGNIEYVLKPEVHKRTFITADDSLVGYSYDMEKQPRMMPSPMTNPAWYSVEYKNVKNLLKLDLPDNHRSPSTMVPSKEVDSYIEAQIVGGVRLQDIERIVIYDDLVPSETVKWFRQRGIKVDEKYTDYNIKTSMHKFV